MSKEQYFNKGALVLTILFIILAGMDSPLHLLYGILFVLIPYALFHVGEGIFGKFFQAFMEYTILKMDKINSIGLVYFSIGFSGYAFLVIADSYGL
jgi:hypothetical protein